MVAVVVVWWLPGNWMGSTLTETMEALLQAR